MRGSTSVQPESTMFLRFAPHSTSHAIDILAAEAIATQILAAEPESGSFQAAKSVPTCDVSTTI